METLIYPLYYRVAYREGNTWKFRKTSIFYSEQGLTVDPQDIKTLYGLSWGQLAIALFRINGGKQGWYLANLKDRQYYYCGVEAASVKHQLRELGIGRADPMAE